MKVNEVDACSIRSWYQLFTKITYKSIILHIPPAVVTYLQDNGPLVLPKECLGDEEDDTDEELSSPSFETFSNSITESIEKLGGKAFPKLNWSSPKDAVWISFNQSMECSYPSDVYLLLKSSDFISHDLTFPYHGCEDESDKKCEEYTLALRQWVHLNPQTEFRCFVKDNKLIGISQRDPSQFVSGLKEKEVEIVDDIFYLWHDHIKNKFPLTSYVFDVHRPTKSKVILLDFGPFNSRTDSQLFSWTELENYVMKAPLNGDMQKEYPEFRCVTREGVQPNQYSSYGFPIEIANFSDFSDANHIDKLFQENGRLTY